MGGSVITVAGGKGGVGKTTVTANVGVALAEQGFDVAAVDADVGMTNLGRMLGLEPERGIHDVLADRADVDDVLQTGPAGLEVVPGEQGLPPAEAADPANLKRAVRPLQRAMDVVLVDTGAGVSHQNLVAAGLADGVVLVTTASSTALGDAGKAAELVDRVETPILGTVLTRATDQTDVEAAVEVLDEQVLAAVPAYPDALADEPRVLEAPESAAAGVYDRLATTIATCHESGHLEAATEDRPPTPARVPAGAGLDGVVNAGVDDEQAAASTGPGDATEDGSEGDDGDDASSAGPETEGSGVLSGLLGRIGFQ